MSSLLSVIDEGISISSAMCKEEKNSFKKNIVKDILKNFQSAKKSCKIVEKLNSLQDVFIIENGILRKARIEEIFKAVRNLEEFL